RAGRLEGRRGYHRRPADRRRDAHGQRAGGEPGGGAGRAGDQEDRPRARGERPVRRARGRRRRRRRAGGRVGAPGEQRAELHRRQAVHRRREGSRRLSRAVRRRHAGAPHGRSARQRHRRRAAGARRAARRAPSAGRGVGAPRRQARARRESAFGSGRLLPADGPGGRRQGHAGLRRGDLRAGRGGHRGTRRGRRDPSGQRFDLRAGRLVVDAGSGARRTARRPHRGGLRLRERSRQVGSATAVRRHQAVGLRTRALGVRSPRVRQREERLDQVVKRVALTEYRRKRRFGVTPEPSGDAKRRRSSRALTFVVQKHRATALHYDFRLEWNGVLLSWAVPKGPSLDPSVKRLAMQTEDHPLEYAAFEGIIPEGEYGGGTVMVWDRGTWEPEVPDVDAALRKGELKFRLDGEKLRGGFVLVRTRPRPGASKPAWLLIKHRDAYASTDDIAETAPRSVVSGRTLAEIAWQEGGNVEKAASGDPPAEIERLIANPKLVTRRKRRAPAV